MKTYTPASKSDVLYPAEQVLYILLVENQRNIGIQGMKET